MIRLYTAAYGNTGMNARQVLEEMVCDAMGKMNAFATEETSTVAGEVGQFLRDLRKAALEAKTEGQKNNAQEGVKHSRELTTDGRVVAVVDEDILSNLDLDNWNQETKKAAKKAAAQALLEFKDGIEVEGITRKVNKTSRDEYTRSRDSARLARNNPSVFADKMRAASVADDIIIATTQWKRDGKLMHPRADNFVDFDHGTVLIESKGRQYSAEVVVGITNEGEAVFYDVVDLSPTTFEIEKVEPHSAAYANESLSAITGGSTASNVAQQEQNVKQKYSRELDSEYMELAKDPEGNSTELRKMVDQAAEEQGYKTLFYHGSKKGGGFTEFKDWQYFTPKKEYAERYAQRGNPDSLYSVFVKMEHPFDTRNAEARRIFQKARDELGLGEIQDTGLPDWTDGYDLADYIDENGLNYDAIVLDEGGDLVNGKPVSRGLSYVVRKSNQVKSADAVVYDDNGKVIPLSERFNSDKSDIRYSRELTTDGRIVAVVDEDILSNLDLNNWNQETKKAAQKAATEALLKFQDGIVVEGITREVTRRSRREFTRSEYTTQLFRERNTAFLDKMRAANNLDDVVIAATDWARDGKLKHPRADNFVDFDHGTTLIASGDAKYEAEVVVGITDKGTAVFYDIVNMQPGNFSIKNEEPSTTATTNKSPGDIHEGSSKARVAQQEQNVKQKFSRELDSEYMELAKDPEGNRGELQEMVDQAAEAAGYEYKRNAKRKHSPANDVPWQMFVRGVDKDQGNYGDYTYYATDKGATSIDEIMPKLRELAEEFYGETVSDEEINPPDIVMSAGVWDDMDFVQYAWDNYFEGEMDRTGKVPAVVTEDGMIVIDEDFSRVKSGDTVEYDDNGKVIPLSERFNRDKRDIRYSRELETVEALKRQNELLQKQRDYWKEQTRTTDEKTRGADKGEVRSLAGQLIRQYSSKTEVEEILPEMQWLADSIWKNDPKISYTDLQDSAQNIARMVLDGSEVNLNAENWETGQELKRFLWGRYINVDESLKEDIGDFKAFKQSNRSLHFRENGTGTGVASLWLELQNDFGKGLFPDSVSNPGDKIRHIADTLTSLTESDMQNPYAADMELTVEQMAADVMARAAGVNRQKATKADNTADAPLLYSVRMLTWAEVSWSMLPSS